MTEESTPEAPEIIGWRTAVSMLRLGLKRHTVEHGVKVEFTLSDEAARVAVDFAGAWLEEARND